jgi:conjugal transfer mating pair stabilization protein TraG
MWTIYSIGDSAYLERILIAVAMVVGTGDFTTVVRIGLLVGLLIVMFQALAQGAQQINWQQALVAWIIFSGLYGATTTVTIEDAYNGQVRTVANVPFGVVALGSLVSEIGFGLTDTFETAFSVPSITRNGFADAMEVVKRVRINSIDRIGLGYANDPSRAGRYDFEQSWISYIRNCTIQGIKIGSPLPSGGGTLTDSYIVNAANLLDALQYQNPSAGTQININGLQSPTCSDAYKTLQNYTLDNFYRDFLQETLANALGEPKDVSKVEARINQALGDLGIPFISAKDFVVTSVLEPMYAKAWASEHGTDLVMSYAITIDNSLRQRAMQWNAEGSMWQRSIRPMITFLEGFVFAVTPFMALVIVMGPFGIRLAGKYLVLLFWIQLWLPVLSIVNLYIMMTIQGKMAALAGSGAGLTLTSISGMMNADGYIQEYLATGQMLAASTPMIALMLVTGAAVTATQFASRIQGGDFVDEKKVAPDTMNSVPFIQQQAPNQVDMQGGVRKQGAETVNRAGIVGGKSS